MSVDVCLGAVAASAFAATALSSPARIWLYAVLFSAVYGIYNLDHAIDASGSPAAADARRAFHREHRSFLWVSSVVALFVSAGIAVYFLRAEVLHAGIALGGFMALYLLLIYLRISTAWKEILTSIGYTAGIWLPHVALTYAPNPRFLLSPVWIFPIGLFISCMLNLYAYAVVDVETDRVMGQSSIAQHHSMRFAQSISIGLFLSGLVLTGLGFFLCMPPALLVISGIHILIQYGLTLKTPMGPGAVRQIGEASYWIFFLCLAFR